MCLAGEGYIVCIHKVPRINLLVPMESTDAPPVPCESIDVMRLTDTDLENFDGLRNEDCWGGKSAADHRPLSARWTGETMF